MATNLPLITVITVTYNAEKFIERTILSVANQKNANIEHIIIDGGSSDSTVEIIKKYNHCIKAWVSEPDSGIYYAMNKGIVLAAGKWLNFMNAGDVFYDENTVHNALKSTKDTVGVIYGDRVIDNPNGSTLYETAAPLDSFYMTMPFGHQACFIRTDLAKIRPYNLHYKLSSDYDLLLNLYHNKVEFSYINMPVCRFLGGGISHTMQFISRFEAVVVASSFMTDKESIKENIFYKTLIKNSLRDNIEYYSSVISLPIGKVFKQMSEIKNKYHKIILYGYGEVGSAFHQLLSNDFVVALDMNYDTINLPFVVHPSELPNYDYDCIVITVLGREVGIKKYLIDNLNVNENNIILFYL